MLAQYEIIVGTVWPHLRAKVSRRRLKKATPAGPKKEAPGVKFDPPGVQFRVLGSPKRASGDLLGRLGRQVGLRRALWVGKGEVESCIEGSWDRLGALLARLGPLLVVFPTRGEGPGRLPEVIFEAFFGRPGREAKKRQFSTYVDVYFVHFSLLCFVPCCLPCCMAGGAAQMQKC